MKALKKLMPLRWMLVLVAALAVSVSMTSCGDDDDDDEGGDGRYPLTGTWRSEALYDSFDGSQYTCEYVFNSDGSGTFHYVVEGARIDVFTDYMVKDGILYIRWEGDEDYDEKGSIRIDGDTFSIMFSSDEDWTVFHKQ